MKTGILTFHRAHNYGAQLQAYALSQTLADMGHEAEFVDYRQPMVEEAFRLFRLTPYRGKGPVTALKIFVSRMLTLPRRAARRRAFSAFARQWMRLSPQYVAGRRFGTAYDALIFGSDQIWTTRFLHRFDPVLWGDADIDSPRRVAYAPSMEMRALTPEQSDFCRRHLPAFSRLSVREDSMKELLQPLTDKDIAVVVDPVFLRDKADYERLAQQSRIKLPPHYVLVYTIGHADSTVRAVADKVASQLSLPVVYLSGIVPVNSDSMHLDTAGPADFLRAYGNADFVVTTTFHGTSFALLFEKPFYSLRKEGISGRAESLLAKAGATAALISSAAEADALTHTVDYAAVGANIAAMRRHALDYLNSALK